MHLPFPGSFRPWLAVAIFSAAAFSAAAQYAIVQKGAGFIQTGPGAPAADPLRTYEFGAFFSGALSSPSLISPSGRNLPLVADDGEYFFEYYATNKLAFDAAFPSGTYTLNATGRAPVALNLGSDLYPSTVPQIIGGTWNAGGLLVLDPTRENTITINAFAGYATTGVGGYCDLQFDGDVEVNRLVTTASLAVFGATVSATPVTTLVIPARSMTSGRVYDLNLAFGAVQVFSTPAATPNGAFTNYSNGTKVYIAALAPGATAVPAPVIVRQPADVTARAGTTATVTIGLTFNGSTTYPANSSFFADWYFNGNVIDNSNPRYAGTNGAQLIIRNLTPADAAGEYSYRIVTTGGIASSNTFRLTVTAPPTIETQPAAQTIAAGSTVVLSVVASGTPEPTYQWRRGTTAIPGATSATLVLSGADASAGAYSCVVTNSAGSVTSAPATLAVSPVAAADVGRLVNLAIRTNAGTGAQTLIVGLATGGAGTSGSKPLLIRSVGPSLNQFGLTGTLVDPEMTVFQGSTTVATNDNWAGDATVLARAVQVGAFGYAAPTSLDAALALAPTAGAYTVQVVGKNNGTGLALAEIYDATAAGAFTAATPRLVNISARTQVGTGGGVLIAGFVIGGTTAKTVLIRAIGPTLTGFGVSGVLEDPRLQLYSGTTLLCENDNWGGEAQLSATGTSVGAFALANPQSKDSVLLVTLPPGSYTAQVSGQNQSTGVALVEVYEVP